VDDKLFHQLENAVGKLLAELDSLREESRRHGADRRRLEEEIRRLREETASHRSTQESLLKLKKENDRFKRVTRNARDHVERMLSRIQTLEE
jgi:predicted  nucleic acid-binding Zn-ribbon protein